MNPSSRLLTFVFSCFYLWSFPSAAEPPSTKVPASPEETNQKDMLPTHETDPDTSPSHKNKPLQERLIRLQGRPGLEVELVLDSGRRSLTLPESAGLPLDADSVTIEAFGFFPKEVMLEPLNGGIQTVTVDLRPVPRVRTLSTWSWAAIGIGLVAAAGAVAVEDSVDFHSAVQKGWIQWSLIGGGGGLFLTGIGLQNWARQLQHAANTASVTHP